MPQFTSAPTAAVGHTTVLSCSSSGLSQMQPLGVSVDGLGNVLIVDKQSGNVFSVASGEYGTSTVIASKSTYNGIFIDVAGDSAGNVMVADNKGNNVGVLNLTSGASLFLATITQPTAVAFDQYDGLYVTDQHSKCLYAICAPYTSLVTVSCAYSSPVSVAIDASQNVYVADGNTVWQNIGCAVMAH